MHSEASANRRADGPLRAALRTAFNHPESTQDAKQQLYGSWKAYLAQFGDSDQIIEIMSHSNMIVTGPGVLQLINDHPVTGIVNRLVFLCDKYKLEELEIYFREQNYYKCHEDRLPAMAPFFAPEIYEYLDDSRYLVNMDQPIIKVVDIYSSYGYALDIVPMFSATPYMNYFHATGFVMLYPEMTLDGVGYIRGCEHDDNGIAMDMPGGLTGYALTNDLIEMAHYRSACPTHIRSHDDTFSLSITFEHSLNATTPTGEMWSSGTEDAPCTCGECTPLNEWQRESLHSFEIIRPPE